MRRGLLGGDKEWTRQLARKILIHSVFPQSEDLTITGNVTSKGALHLDGQFQGDVHCVPLCSARTHSSRVA